MHDNIFIQLVEKFLSDSASKKEEQLIEEYYKKLAAQGNTDMDNEQEEKLKQVMWGQIRRQINGEGLKTIHISWFKKLNLVAAAAIIIIV